MGCVPAKAEWYLAEVIQEIWVEGSDKNIVHKNLILLRATSPDAAYVRALEIGQQGEIEYKNPMGKNVTFRFRGLGHLDVIHDELDDGAELLYQKKSPVSEEEIASWVRSKEDLALFREGEVLVDEPDYSCKEIVDEAIKMIVNEPKT